MYFWHADKHGSLLQVGTIIFSVYKQAWPMYPKLEVYISLQYLQKCMGDEVDFLPADNHKHFLQDDSITLGVRSQACLNYPKQYLCNIS